MGNLPPAEPNGDLLIRLIKAGPTDVPEDDWQSRKLEDFPWVLQFPQTWGSTAMGFGGIGGAAMTTAWTTVLNYQDREAYVYFGKYFAYKANYQNKQFQEDLSKQSLRSVSSAKKQYV